MCVSSGNLWYESGTEEVAKGLKRTWKGAWAWEMGSGELTTWRGQSWGLGTSLHLLAPPLGSLGGVAQGPHGFPNSLYRPLPT